MPPSDLVQAIPGLIIAVFLPGMAMATLLAPRYPVWERAVVAPALSVGVIGILGLVLRLVHIPFSAATVLPGVVLVGVAAGLRARAANPGSTAKQRSGRAAIGAVVAASVFAGAVSGLGIAIALQAQVLPPDWDPAEHGAVANAIASQHDVMATIPVPLEHTFQVRPRMAFEATAAVVSELRGPPPARSMMPIVMVAILFMPLGLAMLALEATGSLWIAGMAPVLSAGMAFPSFQVILGRFPMVVDAGLIAATIVAMARLVRGRDPSANAAMIVALTAAIWVTHGLEAITAALIGAPLVLELLIRQRAFKTLLRIAAGIGAAGLGAGLVTILTAVPRAPTVSHPLAELANSGKTIGLSAVGLPFDPGAILQYFGQGDLSSPIAVALLVAGVVAAIVRRQLLWALGSLILLLAIMLDVIQSQLLKSVWQSWVWPWADIDRVLGIAYWVAPLLMAAGLVWVTQLLLRASHDNAAWLWLSGAAAIAAAAGVLADRQLGSAWVVVAGHGLQLYPFGNLNRLAEFSTWSVPTAAVAVFAALAWLALHLAPPRVRAQARWQTLAAPPTVAVLALVALLSLGIGALQEQRIYMSSVYHRQLATDADLTVMAEMSHVLPAGSKVMTDSNWDAGMWVRALTNDDLLVPKAYIGGELSQPLVRALDGACSDPGTAEHALASFDAIFIGSHRIADAPPGWDPNCIAALKGVREIGHAGPAGSEAHAYQVTRPGG